MLQDLYGSALTELLFEKTDDFVGIYDIQTERFVRVNRAGVRLLGFPSEDLLLAHPVRSRSVRAQPLTPDSRQRLIERLLHGGHVEETAQIGRQNGQTFWGQLIMSSFSANNRLYALIRLINQDQLRQTERDLDYSIRRYEAIFTNATIGIVVCDRQGQIISANQMADQLLGYDPGELTALTIEKLVPTSVSHYHEKLRHSFNANPQVRSMGHNRDLHAQRKDGSVFPIEISLSYFRLDEELYVVSYLIDITLKNEAERQLLAHKNHIERLNADLEQKVADRTHALMNTLDQLEQSKDELARALASERELGELKSRFVSMASHEFRTPLTAVLTSATLIGKYPNSDQQDKRQKHLDRIRTSVNHLNDILEEFLSVGRLEEGKIDPRPAAVYVPALVDEVTTDLRGMLKPGQTIQSGLRCTEPAWLDPSLLRKILVNLLTNALKYSGPASLVQVAGNCDNGTLTLQIIDQGIGIAPDDQEHLFERFFRARNAVNVAGTGLGLHIVGRYVTMMGGQVSLQSELNKGTTVTITIPYETNPAD